MDYPEWLRLNYPECFDADGNEILDEDGEGKHPQTACIAYAFEYGSEGDKRIAQCHLEYYARKPYLPLAYNVPAKPLLWVRQT